jgi:hypothetical protein
MASDLSRQGSRTPLLQADDATSLTSFPDPSSSSPEIEPTTTTATTPSYEPLNGLLDGTGPSMFDEHDASSIGNPQTLANAPADVIHRIIHQRGAVDLIRRLSALLAERDAHVTALTRLAEEHNIPSERISDATKRASQVQLRQLSLAAASEEEGATTAAAPSMTSERSSSPVPSETASSFQNYATIRGFTKLFGGTGRHRNSSQLSSTGPSPASSRSTSRVATVRARPASLDVRSIKSNDSGGNWATALFGSGGAGVKSPTVATSKGPNGTLKRYSASASRPPREPVEMLTRHDRDQLPPTLVTSGKEPIDPQEVEWNKFLLRLAKHREQRPNKDNDELHNAADTGELIGASRFGTEGSTGRQKLEHLTRLVIGGIPMRLRHPIWMELSHANTIIRPDAYQTLLSEASSTTTATSAEEMDAILKDVPRTLTSKYDFYAERGHDRLKRVLVAFCHKYPGLGYTQGLNMIAGYILLAIPEESDAFWLLCTIIDDFFPSNYFSREEGLRGPLADNIILRAYIRDLFPKLSEHLAALEIPPEQTVPLNWFLTAFTAVLPAEALLRIWDVWLCLPDLRVSGLFHIALALLSMHAKRLCQCPTASDYYAYITNQCRLVDEENENENNDPAPSPSTSPPSSSSPPPPPSSTATAAAAIESPSPEKIATLIRHTVQLRRKLSVGALAQVEIRRAMAMQKLRCRQGSSTDALFTPSPPETATAATTVGNGKDGKKDRRGSPASAGIVGE